MSAPAHETDQGTAIPQQPGATVPESVLPELRPMKIGEEAGEVIQAWLGMLGGNPRKRTTPTVDQVIDELADVMFTSLTAIASLGADPRHAVAACAAKAATYRVVLVDQASPSDRAVAA